MTGKKISGDRSSHGPEDWQVAFSMAAQAMCNHGVQISCPWEGDLDDAETERFNGLVAAVDSYLKVFPPASRHQEQANEPANTVEHYFGQSVDNWGALEWFDRLASAISDQDRAAMEGNDIRFETYRAIAASSAMRLVREFAHQVRAALRAASIPTQLGVSVERVFQAVAPFIEGTAWHEARAALSVALTPASTNGGEVNAAWLQGFEKGQQTALTKDHPHD